MGAVLGFLLLLAGMMALAGCMAVGAHLLDGMENRRTLRKKKVRALERRLDEMESIAQDTLIVNPHDVTAQRIFGLARQARKELG